MENMNSWKKYLAHVYFTPGESAAFSSAEKLHRILRKAGYKISLNKIRNWLNTQHVYAIHKRRLNKFSRNPIIAQYPDHNWQADILFLDEISTFNDNKRCILVCIDVISRFAWVEPMRSKKGKDTAKAFLSILNRAHPRLPEKLQTDKGTEFYNEHFKKVLNQFGIKLYSTESDKKAAIAERCIKEIKKLIYRFMTANQTNRFIDQLQAIVDSYNKTYHSSIGMAPQEVNESNLSDVLEKLYGYLWKDNKKIRLSQFKIGDKVRISVSNNLFRKGYKGFWTNEVFVIHEIRKHYPHVMYQLRDMDEEIVQGLFYEAELQKVHPSSERFTKISKILRKKYIKGKLWYLVNWEGEPSSTKRWIPAAIVL